MGELDKCEASLLKLSFEALNNYETNNFSNYYGNLKQISEHLRSDRICRYNIDSHVLLNILVILKKEIELEGSELTTAVFQRLQTIRECFLCLRSSFVNCRRNQSLVFAQNESLEVIFSYVYFAFDVETKKGLYENLLVLKEANDNHDLVCSLDKSVITCVSNLIAGNTEARIAVWPYVKICILNLLSHKLVEISQIVAAFLHNCLLEDSIREEFLRLSELPDILGKYCCLYAVESSFSSFSLFCLELILTEDGILDQVWSSLALEHKLLSLDILAALVESNNPRCKLPSAALALQISGLFKTGADIILKTSALSLKSGATEPQVLLKLVNWLSSATSSKSLQKVLQNDASLLVSSVYLLRCLCEADNSRSGGQVLVEQNGKEKPVFGFRCDLTRLIANLVYKNKKNQDEVREMNGILLLLENSQYDSLNPLIKETCIYALRNVLEDNLENQKVIRSLELRNVADNRLLENIGLKAEIDSSHKIRLTQTDKK